MSYFDIPAISNSGCTTFIDHGPDGYYRQYVERSWEREEPSDAMRLGTAIHKVIVENELPDDVCRVISPDVLSASGSRAGQKWKDFASEHRSKLLLKTHEYAEFMRIITNIRENAYARRLLDMESYREYECYWQDETHGVDRKAKLDILTPTCIVDLKIVNDVSRRGFFNLSRDRGYHRQAVFYRDAVRAKTGEELPFIFIAAQNCEPYSVAIYDLKDRVLHHAAGQLDDAISGIKRATETGNWKRPGCEELITLDGKVYDDEYSYSEE